MRARALFAIMFGLGAGAVAVGVTVSRLVMGPAPAQDIATVAPAIVEAPATVVTPRAVEAPPPAAEALPPGVSAAPPPAEAAPQPRNRALARKLRRPSVLDELPPETAPVPAHEPETAPPPPMAAPRPVEAQGAPVAIVRGGAAPTSRAPGPRIIRVDPDLAGR
jgi:hypothetical protein